MLEVIAMSGEVYITKDSAGKGLKDYLYSNVVINKE